MSSKNKNTLFKNSKYIINDINVDYNLNYNMNINIIANEHYLNINELNIINNNDSKILFYIIYNLNHLLDYNKEIDISILIIIIIKYLFNLYYLSYSNIHIRKISLIINNSMNIIDKSQSNDYTLNDDPTINEDSASKHEENYSNEQALDSLDIDDYDYDEEFDERIENIGEGNDN